MASELEKLLAMGSMAATGGTAQAVLGGAQALYGLSQLPKARSEFERARAAAPSLETPSQFYENYKNAYDATLAGMQNDAIQANLATSVQALQGAGGRALVGGLSQATAQSQMAQNQMLAQERQMRLAAGQQLAAAEERAVGRKEQRSQQQQAYANQAYQAALGNIGAGLGAVGEGLMYSGGLDFKGDGKLAEKAGKVADKAAGAVKKGAGVVADKVQEGASYLKERVGYEMDMMPERINQFKQQRAFNKKMKQAQKNGSQYTPTFSAPELSFTPDMAAAQALEPAPEKGFFDLAPVKGSAIPKEFQNEQAINQLDALAKGYNMVQQYNQFFSPIAAGTQRQRQKDIDNALPYLNTYNQFFSPISEGTRRQRQNDINAALPYLNTYNQFFKYGGMMTDGAFSHKSNPIDIVQEGHKVGEMTGGEYIINPTQAKKIAKESSYARKLFKRFEKNAKNNK